MRRTPLYEAHRRANAKLVDFAGWEMPVHYGSQIEEHHAVRRDAGVFDTSHMLAADLEGPGARAFLRRALEIRPDAEIAAHLGEVLWATGRHDEAKKVWASALKDHPANEILTATVKKFTP